MSDEVELEMEPVATPHSKPHTDFEENFLWAVSYSDMLMVLLCFFILFFSIDEEKKNTMIEAIAAKVDSPQSKNNRSSATTTPAKGTSASMVDVLSSLNGQNVKYDAEKNALTVLLSDDVFNKGQFVLNPVGEKELIRILDLLLPYKDKINLAFIGHTDQTPIGASRKSYLNNNFDLSSLRARHVLERSIKYGFSEKNISLQAAAQHIRNSRTLSITITPLQVSADGGAP